MSVFRINLPKPPDDVWAVAIDFSDRLDIEGGEHITGVDFKPYKLLSYKETVAEIDLKDATRVTLTVERIGGSATHHSWPITDQPSLLMKIPGDYSPTPVPEIIDEDTVVIGPEGGDAPYSVVSFHLRGGEDRAKYAVLITAITNLNRQHSCVLRFEVQELPLGD